ncbi:MAG: YraN family protein [Chitinivibrionales bacterium]|nr:YraN family protein [Chitinivibrionales bacterium]
MNTRKRGAAGEERAAEYLLQKGYRIVSRNYETKDGEIDCIAQDADGTLVFVEVKCAHGRSMGNPLFRVNRRKQVQLAKMARRYLYEHALSTHPCRFDAIAVMPDKIDHLRNAFLA